MTACLYVRARVLDASARDAFNAWYRDDHLPRACAAFGAERAWRGWSRVDPLVHCACYEFADVATLEALRDSAALRGMVEEFDRAWGSRVVRERDYLDIVQRIDGR